MNYLISEEELKDYLNDVNGVQQMGYEVVETIVNGFLKSKQPISLLAEGQVYITNDERPYMDFKKGFGRTYLEDLFYTYGNDTHKIRIYVERVIE